MTATALRARIAIERERRSRAPEARAPLSFRAFVEAVNPTLLRHRHACEMVEAGQALADGEIDRLLVLLPPGYWKSEVWSRLFPAFYLHRHGGRKYGLVSHSANLAWSLSEEARNYYMEAGGEVRRETAAKRRWRTAAGGEMWSEGIEGAFLGLRYHCLTVDDPALPEQAHSPTFQARFRERWSQKILSRMEPGGAVVFVQQRLGTYDPAGHVIEAAREAGEAWHVLAYDEVASVAPFGNHDGPRGFPAGFTVAADWRAPGEVLAPGRFGADEVARLQAQAGTYTTNAQRQQRPSAAEGDFWRRDWFGSYEALPRDATAGGKDWDTAYTKDERNSASAYVETYHDAAGNVYVHDFGVEWYEFPELLAWMKRVGGPHHVEDKAAGKSVVQALRKEQIAAAEVRVDGGDKFARAQAVQAVAEGGRVFVRAGIRERFLDLDRQGLARVTAEALVAGGPDLDLNDAFVQALHRHARPVATAVRRPRSTVHGGLSY